MKTNKSIAALMALCTLLTVSCRNSNKTKSASETVETTEAIDPANTAEAAAQAEPANNYEANVVIKNGECQGVLIEEKADTYLVSVQDDIEIPKEGASVELWKAADGKGVVFLKDWGSESIYASLDVSSEVIGTTTYEEGELPETFPCLGLENGCFKIQFADRQGYIQTSRVDWTAINTF
jgi:hypothetical protein